MERQTWGFSALQKPDVRMRTGPSWLQLQLHGADLEDIALLQRVIPGGCGCR